MSGWHVLIMPDYKPGDLPPEGYLQWHEWAEVQRKAGIRQVQCPTCALWRTPQELSTHEVAWAARDRKGRPHRISAFECAGCFTKRSPTPPGEATAGSAAPAGDEGRATGSRL
jgi:hypothetical protein